MKMVIFIKTSISIILAAAILLGSSGITVIKHSCKSCGDVSVKTESLLSFYKEAENCCSKSAMSCPSESPLNLGRSCCEYKIEQYIVSNYVPSAGFQLKIAVPAPAPAEIFFTPLPQIPVTTPLIIPDKYGGPSIFTLNCQLRA